MLCETVIIVTENGPVRINASDYDPTRHVLEGAQEIGRAHV